MSHFSRKSLIFYGVAISSVVLLFNGVARYGTTHLTPPITIDGQYELQLEPTAQCPQPDLLLLRIQQSGIYINGALTIDNGDATSKGAVIPLTLDGKWRSSQLDLQGKLSSITLCGQAVKAVTIVSTVDNNSLRGQLTFSGLTDSFSFRSDRLVPTDKSSSSSH
jgi:hypothetical protein